MLGRLSLRFRVFLFFCLVAGGAVALVAASLAFGWSRSASELAKTPFVTAFVIFAFANTGLVLLIWLLFDEHVAKPINQLSAALRLRAHAQVDTNADIPSAQYLGDLAPAVEAMSKTASTSVLDVATIVANETEGLRAEHDWLTALLTEIPIATLVLNPAKEIVLYDGQAADILSQIAPPRLKAPIGEYFDQSTVSEAIARLSDASNGVPFTLKAMTGEKTFNARLKSSGDDGHMIFIDINGDQDQQVDARPLIFDFDLLNDTDESTTYDTALRDLCYVAFDTETTGLSVENDKIVQLGAVRILRGRIVEGEEVDTYVDPGCPIPPASTRIHRVKDADVQGAPDIAEVGRAFHQFAQDAVLVAHNAPFDIGLLKRFQRDMAVEWNHPVLDTVLLSAVVFGTNEDHSLDALCDRLSITIPAHQRHTALGDAAATGDVLVKLLPLLEGKGITTFGQLVQEMQRHGRLLQDLND